MMHATLMWTLSDLPGNSLLSRYSTKYKQGCILSVGYLFKVVKIATNFVLLAMPFHHEWRFNKDALDGHEEQRATPVPTTREEALQHIKCVAISDQKETPWKGLSIL